jgi:hypothetical protein
MGEEKLIKGRGNCRQKPIFLIRNKPDVTLILNLFLSLRIADTALDHDEDRTNGTMAPIDTESKNPNGTHYHRPALSADKLSTSYPLFRCLLLRSLDITQ